jgi:peptidoglycan/LPS O-acetylase OafA/YrhL
MISEKRIPALDGLRGIAAIAVMLLHFDFFFFRKLGFRKLCPSDGLIWPSIFFSF